MQDFEYQKPKTVTEAGDAFNAQSDGSFLAGGQTLIPVLKQGLAMPSGLIDLAEIEDLQGITATESILTVGAMTTHARPAPESLFALRGTPPPGHGSSWRPRSGSTP